jgi:Sulfotransferase family
MPDGNPARSAGPASSEPVFILAPPRSFSTVTVAMLSGHPDIYGFPELLAFSSRTVGDIVAGQISAGRPGPEPALDLDPRFHSTRLTGPVRAVAELHEGSQRPDAIQRAVRWLQERAHWPTTEFLNYLFGLVHPRIALEKSPDTVTTSESLAYFLESYPRARYIHLTRHPVTTQRSMQNQFGAIFPASTGRARVVRAASLWYLTHLRIARALSELPEDRWIRLRGEDLLREPEVWLPVILDWLGLPRDRETIARMLRTQDWRFAGTGVSGRLFGGDHKFMQDPAMRPIKDPGPVRFDPSWQLLDEMSARMANLAGYLGYT